jgi:CSLREA domain-containing protein
MADFTVNNLGDTDDADQGGTFDGVCDTAPGVPVVCTLRAAVEEADATGAADTISFSVSGTHTVLNVLSINTPMTIDGNGSGFSGTVIDGADTGRIFNVGDAATPSVTFRDLTIQNGHVFNPAGSGGAAILTDAPVDLDHVALTSNEISGTGVGAGGALLALGSTDAISITDSSIGANTISSGAQNSGAGIQVNGPLTMMRSTVASNQITAGTAAGGGGISSNGGLNVVDSTIFGNSIVSAMFGTGGGGIAVGSSAANTIVNSTISGNAAGDALAGQGGGLGLSGNTTVTNSTFAGNTSVNSGTDIAAFAGTATLKNTIVNSGGVPCASNPGTIVSATPGNNIDLGTTCGLGTTNGNRENTDALLASIALNAPGTTETHALLPGSPAIDTASADCGGLSADQRGVTRPQFAGGSCDVGAFELEKSAPPPVSAPPGAGPAPTAPQPVTKKKCKKRKHRAAAAKKCKKRK